MIWVKVMGQTVLVLGQNLLEIMEKYNNGPYVFFIKVDKFFLKGQYVSTRIPFFKRCLKFKTEIKHKLLMEINKESLRGQYGPDCNIFRRLRKML